MSFWPFRRKSVDDNVSAVEPSVISNGVTVEGNIVTPGEIQVDGTVKGEIRAHTCFVDQLGLVHGRILAEEVLVHGRVIGPIHGVRVQLYSGAHVEGDIINETVAVETGAFVQGAIRRVDNPLKDPSAFRKAVPESLAEDESIPAETFRPLRAIRPR